MFVGFGVFAQDSRTEDSCYELLHASDAIGTQAYEECLSRRQVITITATRTAKSVRDAPASVTVVSEQEVSRSSADSASELLRDVPGVDISDAGQAGLKRIRIRGEEARRVTILIDGQEFTDHREVGTPLLIAPELIERVEVVRGGGSVLYGSKAIGGVVNFITKKGGYHKHQGIVSAQYDSATSGVNYLLSLFGRASGIEYRVSATKADHNDRETPAGTIENTSFENDSVMLYLAKHWANSSLAVSYDDVNASSEVFVEEAVRTTLPLTEFRIEAPQRDREKFALFYDWDNVSDALVKIHFDAYLQKSERQFNTFPDTFFNFGAPLTRNTSIFTGSVLDTTGANVQLDWRWGQSHYFIYGFQFTEDELKQDRHKEVVTNGVAGLPEDVHDEASQLSRAFFAQDEWDITDDWVLASGLRQYWLDSSLDQTDRPGLTANSTSDQQLIGSLALTYRGLEQTTIWSKISQGYIYPSLLQLATGAFAGSSYVSPNPVLDAETSNNFEMGLRYADNQWLFDGALFFVKAEDYIDHVRCTATTVPCLPGSGSRDRVYVNFDAARSFGLESRLAYSFASSTAYLDAAWIRRRIESGSFSTYDSGVPALTGRLGIKNERTYVSGTSSWSDFYIRSESNADEAEPGQIIEHRGGWTTFNFAAGTQFGSKQQYQLSAELINLSDKSYTTATENLFAKGRSAVIKMTAKF